MAEKEQDVRHTQHAYVARRMINQAGTGQILGFIICLLAIGGGIYLSAIGKDTAGIATIITALVTLAGAFLYTKSREKKE